MQKNNKSNPILKRQLCYGEKTIIYLKPGSMGFFKDKFIIILLQWIIIWLV